MKPLFVYILIAAGLLTYNRLCSQCISSGAKSSTIFSNNTSIGTVAWLTPSYTAVSDNVRASAGTALGILSSSNANWNMESGFGFSLPAYAIICGIKVDIEKRAQGLLIGSSVTDNSVRILKNGVLAGSEHASGAAWASSDAVTSYGGPTDTWGTSWTAADINASNFGIAYSAQLNAGLAALFLSAEVDYVQITVYYDLTLPIKITDLSAVCNNNGVTLKWNSESPANILSYTVEKTSNGTDFEALATIDAYTGSEKGLNYSYADLSLADKISYYRIRENNRDGTYNFSSLVSADCRLEQKATFAPNPSSGKIIFDGTGTLSVYNLQGVEIYSRSDLSGKTEVDLSNNPPGIYFYQLTSAKKILSSGKLIIAN